MLVVRTPLKGPGPVSAPNLQQPVQASCHQVGRVEGWRKGAWEHAGRCGGRCSRGRTSHGATKEDPSVWPRPPWEALGGEGTAPADVDGGPGGKAGKRGTRVWAREEWKGSTTDVRGRELTRELKDALVEARGRLGRRVYEGRVERDPMRDGRLLQFSTDPKMAAREILDLRSRRGAVEPALRTCREELMLGSARWRRPARWEAYATVAYPGAPPGKQWGWRL